MDTLPVEVYANITDHVPHNDLLSLCRTSKALQGAAEARIYEGLVMRDVNLLYFACRAVLAVDIRGTYVRRLWFYPDLRRIPRSGGGLPTQFWQCVQTAMTKMINLELLALHDPTCDNTWVLNSPLFKFQLHEANFRLPWDANMVAFLQRQDRLQALQTMDSFDDGPPCALAPNKLQALEIYNGPVLVAMELLACPLTHVQIGVDEDTSAFIPIFLTDLGKVKKSLLSISILSLPEHLVLDALQLRHEIHRCLMRLPSLRVLEVDISRWQPTAIEVYQRMVVTELHTYCPSLTCIAVWLGQHLFMWDYQGDKWLHSHFTGRYQMNETLWLLCCLLQSPHITLMSCPASSLASSPAASPSLWYAASMHPTRLPASPPSSPSIAALPSLAHSLSAFPNMTAVSTDMVHYGTHARTKDISEAKLNEALRRTRQRQNAIPTQPADPALSNTPLLAEEEDEPILMARRKRKVRSPSPAPGGVILRTSCSRSTTEDMPPEINDTHKRRRRTPTTVTIAVILADSSHHLYALVTSSSSNVQLS
ncbi:hypothetical protein B0H21DRAFT_690295 [Amylocystis lapponica]|nr:hypothetical protein B0H21DRAFT_690295 [Amylocystis lapponica]